jgi:hypothetical protein
MQATRPRRRAGALLILGALLATVAFVGPAAAQDPYGPTTTEAPPQGATATCELSSGDGQPGESETATVANVPAGEVVRILFGGTEVGRSEAPPGPDAFTTVSITFTIPDVSADTYVVTGVGDTFSAECSASFLIVAGEGLERPDSDGGGGGSTIGGGSLPRTGIYVGLLLVTAFVLLLIGRAMVEGSRRRHHRVTRLADEVWMAKSASSVHTDAERSK